jgi:hypothetical protein
MGSALESMTTLAETQRSPTSIQTDVGTGHPVVPGRLRRIGMPSVALILSTRANADLRSSDEHRLNVAVRGHILGFAVVQALLTVTSPGAVVDDLDTISRCINSPCNFVLTSQQRNMRYKIGEDALRGCISLWNSAAPPTQVHEAARFVAQTILNFHGRQIQVLRACLSPGRCLQIESILHCVATSDPGLVPRRS